MSALFYGNFFTATSQYVNMWMPSIFSLMRYFNRYYHAIKHTEETFILLHISFGVPVVSCKLLFRGEQLCHKIFKGVSSFMFDCQNNVISMLFIEILSFYPLLKPLNHADSSLSGASDTNSVILTEVG